jgi:hypothetical protein
VRDLLRWTVLFAAKNLKPPGERWRREEVRNVVRAVVSAVTGVEEFRDDDDFVEVLGID